MKEPIKIAGDPDFCGENPEPLCRWTFQEPAGSPRVSDGKYPCLLEEMNG